MKNIFRKGGLTFVCMIASLLVLTSCLSENDETIALKENPRPHAYTSFVNEGGQTVFVYNTGNGSDAYIITDKDGKIEKMNLVITREDGTEYGTVFLYNKMVRSITIKDVTYTFHKNKNDKVDVAVTSNGYTELFTDVEYASEISFDDESNIAQVFRSINGSLGIIRKVNDLIDTDSLIYPYIVNIKDPMQDIDDSSKEFSDSDISDGLKENAADGEDPGLDTSGVKGNEDGAEDNTDIGNGAISSGIGELKVTLTWKFSADIDLHVYEPRFTGTIPSSSSSTGHIYFGNKRGSYTDGYLDIDNTRGYYINPDTKETNTRLSAVENVYWNENPSDGKFYVYLHYYSGTQSGPCTVTVYRRGKTIFTNTVNISSSDHATQHYICTVQMPQGSVSQTRAFGNESAPFDFWMLPEK